MLVGLLLVAALAYVAVVALAFAFQRQLVYLPDYTRVEAGGTDFTLDRGDAVLRTTVADYGLDPNTTSVTVTCRPVASPCPAAGA